MRLATLTSIFVVCVCLSFHLLCERYQLAIDTRRGTAELIERIGEYEYVILVSWGNRQSE